MILLCLNDIERRGQSSRHQHHHHPVITTIMIIHFSFDIFISCLHDLNEDTWCPSRLKLLSWQIFFHSFVFLPLIFGKWFKGNNGKKWEERPVTRSVDPADSSLFRQKEGEVRFLKWIRFKRPSVVEAAGNGYTVYLWPKSQQWKCTWQRRENYEIMNP